MGVFSKLKLVKQHKNNNNNKVEEIEGYNDAKIVIDPGKAFCQRVNFVMRMKRRMKELLSRKEKK
jgi:hypothetical protein